MFTPAGDDGQPLTDPGTTLVPPIPDDPPALEGPTLAGSPLPCGGTADSTTVEVIGVDASTISIATGSDEGARFAGESGARMPTAVAAMAEYCNTLGGLLGRVLSVESYDAAVSEVVAVAERQCEEVLALVGAGYLQASQGVSVWGGCGLPRFDGWPADIRSPNPVPLFAHRVAIDGDPEVAVAIVVPDSTAGRTEAEETEFALRTDGVSVVAIEFFPLTAQPDWAGISERLTAAGVGVVHVAGSCRGATMPLVAAGGSSGPAVIADASSYDDACRRDAIADGVPVEKVILQLPFLPLEDRDAAPATVAMAQILDDFGAPVSGDALQASAAFWNFAAAADACEAVGLLRACLSGPNVGDSSGAGFFPSADERACRVVMRVGSDGFERIEPVAPGEFACPAG